VLIGPTNIADKARVETFVREHGHAVREEEENGVRFLRVEDAHYLAAGRQSKPSTPVFTRAFEPRPYSPPAIWRPGTPIRKSPQASTATCS
jgi:hypothetical protein